MAQAGGLWDPADPEDQGRELGRHGGAVMALAVTDDGRVVARGDGSDRVPPRPWLLRPSSKPPVRHCLTIAAVALGPRASRDGHRTLGA
jgi:hypothetical protein